MLAFVGWCVNGAGLHFPGMLSHDKSFADLASLAPRDAWDAVPEQGKLQVRIRHLLRPLPAEEGASWLSPAVAAGERREREGGR